MDHCNLHDPFLLPLLMVKLFSLTLTTFLTEISFPLPVAHSFFLPMRELQPQTGLFLRSVANRQHQFYYTIFWMEISPNMRNGASMLQITRSNVLSANQTSKDCPRQPHNHSEARHNHAGENTHTCDGKNSLERKRPHHTLENVLKETGIAEKE